MKKCEAFMNDQVYQLVIDIFPDLIRQLGVLDGFPENAILGLREIDFDSVGVPIPTIALEVSNLAFCPGDADFIH